MIHCQTFADLIPVTFVLGFYVAIIVGRYTTNYPNILFIPASRWWDQYKAIPWPDSVCLFISACLLGHDDRGRLMRRTIARYLVVALIQTLRCIDVKVGQVCSRDRVFIINLGEEKIPNSNSSE